MERALRWWQYLPASLDPIAFTLWGLPVYWYALCFLMGAFITYWLAGKTYRQAGVVAQKEYSDFAFGLLGSALVGGKAGFLLVYWWPFISLGEPWWPAVKNGGFGFPGMSFFGGFLAVCGYLFWYAKRHQKSVFQLSDILVLFVPVAFFFGRLGNFLHGELVGRVTTKAWGMYFTPETVLRHPSTLYAAFLEGVLLWGLLQFFAFFAQKKEGAGFLTAVFCLGYGALRFISECFREPDPQIGFLGFFTINQILACVLILVGVGIFFYSEAKK